MKTLTYIRFGRSKFFGDFNMGTLIKECGLKIYRIGPIRIEIIYGRDKPSINYFLILTCLLLFFM